MTVKRSLDSIERPQGPAIISRRALARQQPGFERFTAVALLLVSVLGSALFGGGPHAWQAWQPSWWGAAGAVAVQIGLSYCQWLYAAQGWRCWRYNASVIASTGLTVGGFWPLAHPWAVGGLVGWQVPTSTAPWAAGALLVGAALLADVYPEKTLLRD